MLTVLAIACPPLAVLATGSGGGTLRNLGLTAMLFVPGVLHALRTVEDHSNRRHFAAMYRAMGLDPV